MVTFLKTITEESDNETIDNNAYTAHVMALRSEPEASQFYSAFVLTWAIWLLTSRDTPQSLYGRWPHPYV